MVIDVITRIAFKPYATKLAGGILVVLILSCGISAGQQTTPKGSATADDHFSELEAEFQSDPADEGLRWRVITLARTRKAMGYPVPIPAEARELAAKGNYLFENAQGPNDYQKAINAYQQSMDIAPWQNVPYYECAKILSLTDSQGAVGLVGLRGYERIREFSSMNKFKWTYMLYSMDSYLPSQRCLDEAMQCLHWYLLTLPDEDEKHREMGRALIAQIQGEAEQKEFSIDNSPWTPLIWAARWDDWVTVYLLVNSGANVNQIDSNDDSALGYAVFGQYLDVVQLLVAYGADVNHVDKGITDADNPNGVTPLWSAVDAVRYDIAQVLIAHGADVNQTDSEGSTELMRAAKNDWLGLAQFFMANGANVNIIDSAGDTPLWSALKNGHLDITRILVDHGADVNETDSDGDTPLEWAVKSNHVDVAQILITGGADVNLPNSVLETLLGEALEDEQLNFAQLLIAHGADLKATMVDSTNRFGETPLIGAIRADNTAAIQALLMAGADPNKVFNDRNGQPENLVTPLTYVLSEGHMDVAELLVAHGADVSAAAVADLRSEEFLVGHGADVNHVAPNGWTPLTLAAYWGHLDSVMFLIAHGANVNETNKNGYTPLAAAKNAIATSQGWVKKYGFSTMDVSKNAEIQAFLVAHGAEGNAVTLPKEGSAEQSDPSSFCVAVGLLLCIGGFVVYLRNHRSSIKT